MIKVWFRQLWCYLNNGSISANKLLRLIIHIYLIVSTVIWTEMNKLTMSLKCSTDDITISPLKYNKNIIGIYKRSVVFYVTSDYNWGSFHNRWKSRILQLCLSENSTHFNNYMPVPLLHTYCQRLLRKLCIGACMISWQNWTFCRSTNLDSGRNFPHS